MKLKGRLKNINYSKEGKPQITLELERYLDVNSINDIEEEDLLNIKITNARKSRTLDQNNLLWAIISDIDKKINGIPSEESRWQIYVQGIEEVGAEYEDIVIPSKSFEMFKNAFRAYKILDQRGDQILMRCFIGSSKFDTKQMGELIDFFIKRASELGITILDYRMEYMNLF